MKIPQGVHKDKSKAWRLVKSLYGLKQSPRRWNSKFDSFLKKRNFIQSVSDPYIYHSMHVRTLIFMAIFVDDGLILAESKNALDEVMKSLQK